MKSPTVTCIAELLL